MKYELISRFLVVPIFFFFLFYVAVTKKMVVNFKNKL